jgi:hypothetical protein
MIVNFGAQLRRLSFAGAAVASLASPAFAHHVGPSGGAGGGFAVFAPETLHRGHGAAWVRLVDSWPQQRSESDLASLANRGIDAHNTRYDLNAFAGVAYGVSDRVTVSAQIPYVRHDSIRVAEPGGDIEQLGSAAGMGDVTLLAQYRLTPGEEGGVALIGGLKLPTGSTRNRDAFGQRFETEHQPGTGSWDPMFGASAATQIGPVVLAASALYQLAGNGAQDTRLGDRLQGGISVGHHFGPTEHHHQDEAEEVHEHHHRSWDVFVEFGGEWEGRQTVAGEIEESSGGSWVYAAPGVRFNSASGWSTTAALALPLWQHIRASHPDNGVRLLVSLGKSF